MASPSRRVVFVGAVHEAEPALRTLLDGPADVCAVVTAPEESAGSLCGYVDLVPLARTRGVPVLRTRDVNDPATVAEVRRLSPDLLVVIGWSRLIGPELLGVPRRGCVGCHASLLPRHRGRAPVNWAIIRGETRTGNTMMLLSADADTGDIVDQRTIDIEADDTCATVYAKVGVTGADMLREHLPALLAGTAPRRVQRLDEGDVLPKRTAEMGITDWSRPARAVHDWVRALTRPYPGAFTHVGDRRVRVWSTRLPAAAGAVPTTGQPGRLLEVGPGGVLVSTGTGPIVVTEMSGEGELPAPAGAWCERAGVAAGETFAPVDPATTRWALGLGPRPVPGEVAA